MKRKDLTLLNMYFDEWKFRLESLWKRIVQFCVIIFFVSTFPITVNLFEGVEIPQVSLLVFPIAGIALSAFFLWFCLSESIRIKAVDETIKLVIRNNYPEKYNKTTLTPLLDKRRKSPSKILTWRIAIWVPILLSSIEAIIAIGVFMLILTNRL